MGDYEFDVFISYRQNDNKYLSDVGEGWGTSGLTIIAADHIFHTRLVDCLWKEGEGYF